MTSHGTIIETIGAALVVAATVGAIVLTGIVLSGCTPAQVERAWTYQDAVASMCSTAMLLATAAGPVGVYIIGGCATEAAVAKLALDPTSLAWLQGLVAKAKR